MTIKERIANCVALNTPIDVTIKYHHGLYGYYSRRFNTLSVPHPLSRRTLHVFLHEIGHYHLHRDLWDEKPIHREEYEAHMFSFQKMRESGLSVPIDLLQKAKFYTYICLLKDQENGFTIDPEVRRFAKDYDDFYLRYSVDPESILYHLSKEYKDKLKNV